MSHRITLFIVACAAIGGAAGSGARTLRDPPPRTAGAEAEHALRVEIATTRFDDTRPTLELRLENGFSGPAKVQWAEELVTDRGRPVRTSKSSGVRALEKKLSSPLELPKHLDDGFYELRVSAAGRAGDESTAVVRSYFLEVRGGDVEPLEMDDYLTRSRANEGVRL